MEKVDILLATYNGEKYLEEQLKSIVNQTYTNWNLIIRDDGSTDNTLNIIEEFIKKYPEKSFLIKDDSKNVGSCLNFSKLIDFSSSKYIMFCDQDDFWIENKVEVSLDSIIQYEKKYGNIPLVVYTDLKVVDEKLNSISDSLWAFTKLNPERAKKLNLILSDNCITGCTSIINLELKNIINYSSEKIPKEAIMHDWWIGIVACVFGKAEYINKSTILYRQHNNNVMGTSENKGFKKLFSNLSKAQNILKKLNNIINYEKKSQKQAKKFIELYSLKLKELDYSYEIINNYAFFEHDNFLIRKIKRLKYGFFLDDYIRNLILFMFR